MRRFYLLHEQILSEVPDETKSATLSRISGAQPISETASLISPDPWTAPTDRFPQSLSAELARHFTLGWSPPAAVLRADRPQARRTDPSGPRPDADVRELLRPPREDRRRVPDCRHLLGDRKDDAVVELTLPEDANLYASKYQLYLPSKHELAAQLAEVRREIEQREGGGDA